MVTADDLYEMVRGDDLYFRATGGGITFGGGEALLQADFFAAFRAKCKNDWRLCAETSLAVDRMLDYARMAEKKARATLKTGYEFYNPEQWEKGNQEGKRRSVSVNLSRSDIREDRNIPGIFYELIKKYDLDPEQLRIEITETAYVENPGFLIQTTSELREYGFQVEMDDFGSGYSSLHMLKEVPVDRIKMDLHFLTGTGDMEKSRIIITQVIKMIELLGMKLIAEGVETKAQADFLKERGCQEMQGYYFYKPMPVEDFEKAQG